MNQKQELWGVGSESASKAFDKTKVGDETIELIFGEHPHSRQDNDVYARFPDGSIEGFNGHRILHEIKFEDYNYVKRSSLSGTEVRPGGRCRILMNGYPVHSFFFRDIQWAMLRAHNLLPTIWEHPIRIWDDEEREELVGRKIWWHDQPAVVDVLLSDGDILIAPDYPDNSGFRPVAWMINDHEDYGERTIKVSFLCDSIYWFRNAL